MTDLPLVLQLQRDAADQAVSISALLRKAKMVASKLSVMELSEWIDRELNGYRDTAPNDLPEYRKIHGQPQMLNPYHGWQPVYFEDATTDDLMSRVFVMQSIGSLENSINYQDASRNLHMPYDNIRLGHMMKTIPFQTEVNIKIPSSTVYGITEGVRNVVLNWALELERQGVLGEGYSFSENERGAAQPATQHVFNGPVGVVGAAHHTSVQAANIINNGIDGAALTGFLEQARGVVNLLPEECRKPVKDIVEKIEDEANSPKSDMPKIERLLASLRVTLEGAAGNVFAAGLLALIKALST